MNQQPQIFEQLANQDAARRLVLFRNFVNNNLNADQQFICLHQVILNNDNLQIIPGQPQCNCLRNQNNQVRTFFQSILKFLFSLLTNTIEENEENIPENHIINRFLNRRTLTNQTLEFFRQELRQYKVYVRINNENQEAINLQRLENFALNNNFRNQISFTIIEFPTCFLKMVEFYNGQILNNTYHIIKGGYIKLLEFFFQAQQSQQVLNPVCFHTVNLGQQYVQDGRNFQYLQTSQEQCQNCENNIEIPQSFGKLMQYILERDEIQNQRNISDLVNRIVKRQINSLRLILEFFDENYTDKIEETYLIIQNYEPIPRRQIQNIDLHLNIEIEWYKKYFLRKTFSILSNVIVNLGLNQTLQHIQGYENISILLNCIELIYNKNEQQLYQRYQILYHKNTIQEIQGDIQQIQFGQNQQNFQIEQVNYENELNILNEVEEVLRNPDVLQRPLFYEQLKFRICCCFCCDTFFLSNNIISNMELYLNHTQYVNGIQFQYFELFLNNIANCEVISAMTEQLIMTLQNPNQVIQQQ
ncbi:unnamed protein product [Paramecium sonneborni]|uniref:Uncharacterized protein n=1 Tax=Paramecium sonneborni TaxID=65129 RepID=A0A8S1P5W6_9CILI|nr:unnamed protein product [Paramecium sonneborni]